MTRKKVRGEGERGLDRGVCSESGPGSFAPCVIMAIAGAG